MLIIDLDKNKLIHENKNEKEILPEFVIKELKQDLNSIVQMSKSKEDYQKNAELCRVFLKIFVNTLGNYKKFITPVNNSLEYKTSKFMVNFDLQKIFDSFEFSKIFLMF